MTPLPEDETATGTRASSLRPVGKSTVPDRLYDLNLKRLMEVANERTLRELGPVPPGGLPATPRRKAPRLAPTWQRREADRTQHHLEDPDMKLTPVAAAAALALSGCAQPYVEQYPKTPPPPPLSAQATPTPPPPMTQEEAASAVQVNDLAQRLLRLIDGLPSIADLNRERVEAAFGVKMRDLNRKFPVWHAYFDTGLGELGLTLHEPDPSSKWPDLFFHLGPKAGDAAPWTPVCVEFEPYAAALMAKGFNAGPNVGNHGELLGWNFSRFGDPNRRKPEISIRVSYEFPSLRGEDGGRQCINWIELN